MKIAIYIGKTGSEKDAQVMELLDRLSACGCELYGVAAKKDLMSGTDMLLSIGGDGTFLYAAAVVSGSDVPIVGVNLGRLGFLSENRPEDVAEAILSGDYTVESRTMLQASSKSDVLLPEELTYSLNEVTVHRNRPSMLGVEVKVDGVVLPTYWADGLVISTSSGSTAYSLSVGGPIALPEAKVLIISPIAPHNLNVRPLVVPDTSKIELRMSSRDDQFVFSSDNRSLLLDSGSELLVSVAQFSLKRVRLNRSNFINALTQKLFWGEDVRNIK